MLNKSIIFSGLVVLFIAALSMQAEGHDEVGGRSEEMPADDHIKEVVKKVCKELKEKIAAKCKEQNKGKEHHEITDISPVTFRSQVVAGTNHCVKLCVTAGTEKYVWHAKLHEGLDSSVEVLDVSGPHDKNEKL